MKSNRYKKLHGDWLNTALYYNENLPAIRTFVNNWTSAGLSVSRAKDVINVEDLVPH